jgi:hypothetical protein
MATEKLSPGVLPTKAKPKRVALYCRISTGDQHLETQLLDLREMAKQRGYEIVQEYRDIISGSKAKRPGLDQLLADVRHITLTLCSSRPSIESQGAFAISWKCSTNWATSTSNSLACAKISTREAHSAEP